MAERSAFYRFILRFLAIVLILGLAASVGARPLVQSLLPLFASEIARLDDTFHVDRLSIDRDGVDQVVRLDVSLAHSFTLNGHTFEPDPRGHATASTLAGNVTLPCVLLIAVALSWPCGSKRAFALRVVGLAPALLVLIVLCVPFILWASLWGLVVQTLDPRRFSPLLIWSDCLHSGGAFALAMALGASLGSLSQKSQPPA